MSSPDCNSQTEALVAEVLINFVFYASSASSTVCQGFYAVGCTPVLTLLCVQVGLPANDCTKATDPEVAAAVHML